MKFCTRKNFYENRKNNEIIKKYYWPYVKVRGKNESKKESLNKLKN